MTDTKRLVTALLAGVAVMTGATATMAQHGIDIAVVSGKTDDEFWNRIKMGIDHARLIVEAQGGTVPRARRAGSTWPRTSASSPSRWDS
jgi:simple sugar transport system substrate-binding protein